MGFGGGNRKNASRTALCARRETVEKKTLLAACAVALRPAPVHAGPTLAACYLGVPRVRAGCMLLPPQQGRVEGWADESEHKAGAQVKVKVNTTSDIGRTAPAALERLTLLRGGLRDHLCGSGYLCMLRTRRCCTLVLRPRQGARGGDKRK